MLAVDLSQQARQLLHSLFCFDAGQLWLPSVTTVDVHGQLFTGPWLIMCEDILIIKFFGTTSGSMSLKNFASRVGSQCLVSGVRLHTSNIFFKCSGLWMSPESCHLNQGSPEMSVTIASTHRGSVNACSLLSRAALTFLNLYLPFIA